MYGLSRIEHKCQQALYNKFVTNGFELLAMRARDYICLDHDFSVHVALNLVLAVSGRKNTVMTTPKKDSAVYTTKLTYMPNSLLTGR